MSRRSPPPQEFRRWYATAEQCIGLAGQIDSVRWLATPHPWTDGRWGLTYAAWEPPHRITVNAETAGDSAMIIHESIHDILSYHIELRDTARHTLPYFDGRCSKASYP